MTKEKNTPISNEIKIMQSHLQELRKIAGWSADELGQKMGMTRQAINSMEKNNPSTTMNQVHYLALIHLFTSECENNKKNKALATVLNMLFNDPDQYQKNKAEIDKNIKKLAAINKKDLSDEEANEIRSSLLNHWGIIPVAAGVVGLSALLTKKILGIGKREK